MYIVCKLLYIHKRSSLVTYTEGSNKVVYKPEAQKQIYKFKNIKYQSFFSNEDAEQFFQLFENSEKRHNEEAVTMFFTFQDGWFASKAMSNKIECGRCFYVQDGLIYALNDIEGARTIYVHLIEETIS